MKLKLQLRFILAILVLTLVAALDAANSATRCEQQFKKAIEEVVVDTAPIFADVDFRDVKIDYSRALVRIGLSNTSYVTKWSLTPAGRATSQGRFPAKGEFVVTGVPSAKINTWMNQVGKNTVGLVLDDLPENSPGTASLRIGRHYFEFWDVRDFNEGPFRPGKFEGGQMTELTLPITIPEQKAILDFIKARQHHAIIAKHSRGAGVKEGEPIAPEFDSHKFTLAEESCAAACTSWFDARWLEHYDAPAALKRLAEKFDLKSTFVAKQMVWGHVRLPGPIGITIFGIEYSPELMASFKEKNEWHTIRGIPAYGYIPDPKSGQTGTVKSKRMSLEEWLNANR